MLSRDCKRSWHGPWHVESVLQGPWLSHVARRSVGPALALAAEPLQWDCMQWDVSLQQCNGFHELLLHAVGLQSHARNGSDAKTPKRQNAGGASTSNAAVLEDRMQWDCMQWDVSCSNAVGFTNCSCMQWDCSNANGPRVSCHRRGSAPPREAGHEHGILANIITL